MNALSKAGDLYPWTLHKAGAQTKTVWNDDEKAAAEADGWCVNPPDQQPKAATPEPDAVPEVAPEPAPDTDAKPRRRR